MKPITPPRLNADGVLESAEAYDLKACPRAADADPLVLYRRSGSVVGDRLKISRNIDAKAQQSIAAELDIARLADERLRSEYRQIASLKRITIAERLRAAASSTGLCDRMAAFA